MNKRLKRYSVLFAAVIVSANQECLAEKIEVTAKEVMLINSENDNTITLKGINLNAPQFKDKLIEGNTIKLTIPEKIGDKQVVLAPKAFHNLDMKGASLELKFDGKVKLPSDCSDMFASEYDNKSPITFIDFGDVDTSDVTTMNCMFWECKNLKSLNVSNFNTQNVKNMNGMFWDCKNLKSLDLSSFNTQNVENMRSMFDGCDSLKSLDLRKFNTHKLQDMYYMFNECNNLKLLKVNTDSFDEDMLNELQSQMVKIIDIASLEAKRNELNQIYWRIVANNAIVTADPDGEHAWIKDDNEYGESIMEVIGKAIGDCVTGENEFANPTEDGLILFKGTEPEDYEPEHWNAVFLYNYIKAKRDEIYDEYTGYLRPDYKKIDFNVLQQKLYEHYENDYKGDKNELFGHIDQAKRDIQQYNEALKLENVLKAFFFTAKEYDDRNKEEGQVREALDTRLKSGLFMQHIHNICDWMAKRSGEVSEYEKTNLVKKEQSSVYMFDQYISIYLSEGRSRFFELMGTFEKDPIHSDEIREVLKQEHEEECQKLDSAYNILGELLKNEVILTLVGIDRASSKYTTEFDNAQDYWKRQSYKEDKRVAGLLTKDIPQYLPGNNARPDKQKGKELLYITKLKVHNKEYDITLELFDDKLNIKSLTSRTKKYFTKQISDDQNDVTYNIPQCFEEDEFASPFSEEYKYVQKLFKGLLS